MLMREYGELGTVTEKNRSQIWEFQKMKHRHADADL